jgi:hypothetical protein
MVVLMDEEQAEGDESVDEIGIELFHLLWHRF